MVSWLRVGLSCYRWYLVWLEFTQVFTCSHVHCALPCVLSEELVPHILPRPLALTVFGIFDSYSLPKPKTGHLLWVGRRRRNSQHQTSNFFFSLNQQTYETTHQLFRVVEDVRKRDTDLEKTNNELKCLGISACFHKSGKTFPRMGQIYYFLLLTNPLLEF